MIPSFWQWLTAQDTPEVVVNSNFFALQHQGVYAMDPSTTENLTWGYIGGRWGGFSVSPGTLSLTTSVVNYVVVARSTGVISVSTSSTNWDDLDNYARVYRITAGATTVDLADVEDHRAGPGGVHGGGAGGGGGGGGAAPVVTESGTSLTADDTNAGNYTRFTSSSAKTYTFDDSESYAVGDEYHGRNVGAGDLTLAEAGGMTLNPPAGGTLVIPQGGTFTVKIVASDEADVFGVTEEAS